MDLPMQILGAWFDARQLTLEDEQRQAREELELASTSDTVPPMFVLQAKGRLSKAKCLLSELSAKRAYAMSLPVSQLGFSLEGD